MDHRSVSVSSWNEKDCPLSIVDVVLGSYSHEAIDVHRAIGRRLSENAVNQPVDKVISDARNGHEWAVDIIETVELPAPVARLTMPEQDFGTGRMSSWCANLAARLVPGVKRTA